MKALSTFFMCCIISGCDMVYTIHPLAEKHQAEFDPRLIGSWTTDQRTFFILDVDTTGGDSSYALTIIHARPFSPTQPYDTLMFHLSLTSIQSQKFLYGRMPTHDDDYLAPNMFFRVRMMAKDTMLIDTPSMAWFSVNARSDEMILHDIMGKDTLVVDEKILRVKDRSLYITSTTRQLRSLLEAHVEDREMFQKPSILSRIKEPHSFKGVRKFHWEKDR
jgi:hypothetical protein